MPSFHLAGAKATDRVIAPSTKQVTSYYIGRLAWLTSRAGALAVRCASALAVLVCALQFSASAETIRVRHPEGTLHGFLSLTDREGKVLADGDLIETVRGDRVSTRLTFHFKDGSVDDETTVFTQRGTFRLLTDHHVQKGPYFPHPLDLTIDVPKGLVTQRTVKDGKENVSTDHMRLPPDLYNGLITPIVKSLSSDVGETRVSMIVSTPKPRVVKLLFTPQAQQSFSLVGIPRKALAYDIKIELGGVVGVIAPIVGKEPPRIHIWVAGGEVPVFLREEGPLFEGGDILAITLIGPTWPAGK